MHKVQDIIIIGAANPDIVRLVEDINQDEKRFNLIGFLEKDPDRIGVDICGYPVLGGDDLLLDRFKNTAVVNNVFGSAGLRQKICRDLKHRYHVRRFPNLIHPSVSTRHVFFGEGNIVYEYVSLAVNVEIGDFNLLFPMTCVAHETRIGSMVLLAPGSTIGSRSTIGDRVIIGNHAVVNMGVTICDDVFIGAGSNVIDSINEPDRIFGNPAISSIYTLKFFSIMKKVIKIARKMKKQDNKYEV